MKTFFQLHSEVKAVLLVEEEDHCDHFPKPGTTPIPEDHVRLYHQTSAEHLDHIKKHGIRMEHARGIEGPKAIWADEKGFYGKPADRPTVEFHIPKKDWNGQGHIHRSIEPHEIIATHHPWHQKVHYALSHPSLHAEIKAGEHDHWAGTSPHDEHSDYSKAFDHIKKHH